MKPNYQEPLHTLKQILQETPDATAELAYAVVVGPLYRHTTDDNLIWKAFLPDTSTSYTMSSGGSTLSATGVVDLSFVEVLARNVDVQLWTGKDGDIYAPTIVQFDTAFLNTEDTAVADSFDEGRWIQPGDILLIDDGSTVVRRRAVELLGVDQAATLTNFNAFGATTLGVAAATLISTSIVAIEQADVSSAQIDAAFAVWVRQNGIAGSYAGLGVLLEVECATPGANAGAATFIFRANGETVVGSAAMNGSDAEFEFELGDTVSTLQLVLAYNGAWTAGQVVAVRHEAPVAAAAQADYFGAPDLSGYTMIEANKRVNGQISIEVLSVASNTDVALRVRSTENLFAATTYNITTGVDVTVSLPYDGGVVEFTLDSSDIRANAYRGLTVSMFLAAPSRSTTVFDKVRLNAQVGITGAVTIDGLYVFTGIIPAANDSADNYAVGASTLALTDASLPVPGYPDGAKDRTPTASGEYAVVWRELVPPAEDESLLSIRSREEIIDLLGSDHQDSEVGYGALCCLVGGEGREFKVLRTNGSTLEDFQEAFARIATTREAYALGILTEDEDVMLAAAAHAFTMSDEYNKHSRRCYVGTDTPTEFFVINLKEDSSNYLADFIAGDNGNNLVEADDEDLDFSLASVGDFLVLDATGDQYLITAISDNVVTLASGPLAPLSGVAIKVLAADTAANTVKFVSQRTARLGSFNDQDRRISNIWCDRGTLGGAQQKMRFVACEMAGARVAIPPNQGLTRHAVKTISAAPNMHRRFTRTQLNELGAAGVWVITQESPTGKVRVRHQLTIATTGGILFYEDSVGVNIDLLCFELDDLIDAEIGVVNANRRSLINLKSLIIDKMASFTVTDDTPTGRRLGPRIEQFYDINENPGTITLVQDPNLKDQFNHALMVDTATPLNRVRTTLTARVTNVNGTLVSTINTIPA